MHSLQETRQFTFHFLIHFTRNNDPRNDENDEFKVFQRKLLELRTGKSEFCKKLQPV